MKNIALIITVLFTFNLYSFSQKDTTICFDINSSENGNIKKSVFGIDLCYNGGYYPMFGINYELYITKNNTLSFSTGSNIYPFGRNEDIISYGKMEYRFYFPDTGIPKTSSFRNDFYLQKKKKALPALEGFYLGIAAIYKKYQSKTLNSQNVQKKQEFINSCGIGGSLGYQFVLFKKIQTNISLPLVFGCQRIIEIEHYKPNEKTYLDISGFIDINFGIAF